MCYVSLTLLIKGNKLILNLHISCLHDTLTFISTHMINFSELPIITNVLHSGQLNFYLNERHFIGVPSGA